ncbi:MAG: hypothetical protein K5777_08315 [Nitrosopumilus sp.]|nr:hypothetical protein [Nitrosopumilus sp.]
MDEKTMAQIMQEEKEKLLAEINEKIKKKKALMNTDEPETGFQNFIRK